jgi:hypothetical protein
MYKIAPAIRELIARGYIRKDLFGKWNYNCISYAEELKRSKKCSQNVRIVDTKSDAN